MYPRPHPLHPSPKTLNPKTQTRLLAQQEEEHREKTLSRQQKVLPELVMGR